MVNEKRFKGPTTKWQPNALSADRAMVPFSCSILTVPSKMWSRWRMTVHGRHGIRNHPPLKQQDQLGGSKFESSRSSPIRRIFHQTIAAWLLFKQPLFYHPLSDFKSLDS
jgi:hypothetical protein